MSQDCLKLTIYFGEPDRADGRYLADALTDIYARHELQTSLVMRGVEGFGVKHHLHTDRLLTLSEDLPLVSVAVDRRPRIELRAAGASGATSLRGIWGYDGDDRPHGDSFWQLRRRLPIVTVIVDTPRRIRPWFELIDELTRETGLVTSEIVPAFRATGPQLTLGGLALAQLGND